MFGFFRFLRELFTGNYRLDGGRSSVNPVDNPGAFPDSSFNTSSSNAHNSEQRSNAIENNVVSNQTGINKFFGSLTEILPALVNRITAGELTGAEREQNAFNAQQAQIDREFQERMSNTEYQRGVADMRAAGVNPALAIGNGGASTPSGSTASGSGNGMPSNLGEIMQLFMFKPQLDLLKAQTEKTKAEAAKTGVESGLVQKRIDWFDRLSQSTLDNVNSMMQQRDVQNQLSLQGISESMAREALDCQKVISQRISNSYASKLNDSQLKYQDALTAFYRQKSKESAELVKKYAAEIDGIYQQAILHAAQAGYFTQAEENMLTQNGILELDKESKQFSVDKMRADRNWRIASTVFGMTRDVVTAAGAAAVGAGALGRAGLLGAGAGSVQASPWTFSNTGGFNFYTF